MRTNRSEPSRNSTNRLNAKLALSQLRVLTTLKPTEAKGLVITPEDLQDSLTLLGKRPSPARILEALTIARRLELSPPCPPHLQVLRHWIKRHRLAPLPAVMAKALESPLTTINWPSACPCPLIGFSLAITPVREGPITLDTFLTLLRERPNTVTKEESVATLFEQAISDSTATSSSQQHSLAALRASLMARLSNLSAITFGFPTRDLYFVGRTPHGQISGVVTTVIEDLEAIQEGGQGVICPAA